MVTLIVVIVLVLSACSSNPPKSYSHAERAVILESYYSTVEVINRMITWGAIGQLLNHPPLDSQALAQIESGDFLGAAKSLRALEKRSLSNAEAAQRQVDVVDEALEKCLPEQLVGVLELHRKVAALMRDAFEAEAKWARLTADAFEVDPGHSGVSRLLNEARDASAEQGRLIAEAETAEERRGQRETQVFEGTLTPRLCD